MALLPGIAPPPGNHFSTVGLLKVRDPILVGHIFTSRCYCPFHPSTSQLRQLSPYYFNTAATPPAAPPPGLCLLLIAWLNDLDGVRGCFCLFVGGLCLPSLSFRDMRHPRPLPGGLEDRLHPATHSHKCWFSYRAPSGICARLSFPVYIAHVHLAVVCGGVLFLCPAGS